MGILDAPPIRPRAITDASIWGLGDSITKNGYTDPTSSVSHLFGKQSYVMWACLLSGGRLRFGGVAATGGYTTAQIVSTHLPTVLAARPAYCVVHAGTNDIGTLTLSQTIANLTTIFDSLLSAGILPIATTMLPKHTLLGASRAPLDRMSMWITRYARQKNFPVVDWTTPHINPSTGDWVAYSGGTGTYNADDTHPNSTGAKSMGQLVWNTILAWSPPKAAFFPAQNLQGASPFYPTVSNALHLTDTNSDGIPDNYTATTGGGQTFSIGAMSSDEGLGNWFNIGQAGVTAPFPQGTTTAITPGNRMLFVCKVKTAGVVSSSATWNLRLTDGGTVDIMAIRTIDIDLALGGFHIEFTIPASVGTSTLKFIPYVQGDGASISVGQVGIYDLTAQGVV